MTESERASDAQKQEWSIAKVLRWASEDFERRGLDSPRLDAELLLAHVLGTTRIQLIIDSRRILNEDELGAFRKAIQRRRAGEPVAYILGTREFFGLPMRVDRRVLIPRPDTETLVEVALQRSAARSMYGRALDVCTGSGCVAIAFAHARPTWRVTGLDVSDDALAVARENALRNAAVWGVDFARSDLLEGLAGHERFELITANPPYIPSGDVGSLERGIRDFEPHLALDGGLDGLAFVRRIVARAPEHLAAGGILALEIGADQGDRVQALFEEAGLSRVERQRDYGGHERVVSGIKSGP